MILIEEIAHDAPATKVTAPQAMTSQETTPPTRVARIFLSLSAASFVERLLNLALGIYARHIFGTDITGQLAWSSSVVLYAALVVSPGLSTIARREVAREPKLAARYTMLLFVIQIVLALAAFALTQFFGHATGRSTQIQLLLLFNAINLLIVPFDLGWILQAHERQPIMAFFSIGLLALQTVAMFALIHGPSNVFLYVLLPYPFRLVFVAFTIWYSVRHGFLDLRGLKFKFVDVRPLLIAAIPVGMGQAMVLLYGNSDVLFLGLHQSATTVGLYSTAYSMMLVPTFLHGALTNSYFSSLARALDFPERAKELSLQLLRSMIWLGFPLAALGWAVGRHPMTLIFGKAFAGSGPLCEWLYIDLALIFFNVGYFTPLTAWKHQNIAFRCTLTGAIVNVGLNLWLIPQYGAWGAVVSTLLSEVSVLVAIVLVRRNIHPLTWPRFALFPAIICLTVALATRFATNYLMPWWCAALLGTLALLASCALLETDWRRAVLHRLRGLPPTISGV